MYVSVGVFFFKQKTAYEMRISDWSSDVCSSDLIGYVRVSTFDQNVDRQLDGQSLDRIFTDKASGKDINRPELDAMLAFAREGDTVVVHSMDRLARNLDDLRKLVKSLTKRGVRIEFVKESLAF